MSDQHTSTRTAQELCDILNADPDFDLAETLTWDEIDHDATDDGTHGDGSLVLRDGTRLIVSERRYFVSRGRTDDVDA